VKNPEINLGGSVKDGKFLDCLSGFAIVTVFNYISGPHVGKCEDDSLLGYYVV
jgi:hypothetical protein